MPLYPEQVAWLQAIDEKLNTSRSVIAQAPVGFGKTECFVAMVSGAVENGHRVLVLAHMKELIRQISQRFLEKGQRHGFIAGGFPELPEEAIQIATPQSLLNRWNRYGKPKFTQLIEDEGHNATAPRFLEIHRRLDPQLDARVGVSATPCNLNGTGMKVAFEAIHVADQPRVFIELGRLAKPIIWSPPVVADLSKLKSGNGDYTLKSLASVFNTKPVNKDCIEQYLSKVPGTKALVFCCDVQDCYDMKTDAAAYGIRAEVLEGRMSDKERTEVLAQFSRGDLDWLISRDLIFEGFDCPDVMTIILKRRTKSLRIYLQAIGRGMRSDGGRKKYFYVIDCAGNVYLHGMPDFDREWGLEGGAGAASSSSDMRQCMACLMWNDANDVACFGCGNDFAKKVTSGKRYKVSKSGALVEVVDIKPRKPAKQRLLEFKMRAKEISSKDPDGREKMEALAVELEYEPGFGTTRWKMKTGEFFKNKWKRDKEKQAKAKARA